MIFKKFWSGLSSFKDGHAAIKKYKLWRFVLLPGLVNVLFILLLLGLFFAQKDNLVLEFGEDCPLGDNWSWLCEFGQYSSGFLTVLFQILVAIALLFIYILIYKYLIMMFFGPFFSLMIDAIHLGEGGEDQPFSWKQFIKDAVRGIKVALRWGLAELIFTVSTFVLLLIPVVGLVQPFLVFFIAAYYMGANMLDYSQEKFKLSYKESVQHTKQNKSLALGLGTGFQLLFFIPVLGWLLAPAYTVAAGYYAYSSFPKQSLIA